MREMATNLPFCFSIQFLEQLLKFLVNFTLLKYVKSQRNYGFLTTKELIFGFQILDLKNYFSASLTGPFRIIPEKEFVLLRKLEYLKSAVRSRSFENIKNKNRCVVSSAVKVDLVSFRKKLKHLFILILVY